MTTLQSQQLQTSHNGELTNPLVNPFGITEKDIVAVLGAHPDDIEVMKAYAAMEVTGRNPAQIRAQVAVHGENSTRGKTEFVQNGGRILEAIAGLGALSIRLNRMYMPGLPDGSLSSEENFDALVNKTAGFFERHQVTIAITPGVDGGDGSPDHMAVHFAAAEAKRLSGRAIRGFGLNAQGAGEVIVPGSEAKLQRKMGAIAYNKSQFNLVPDDGRQLSEGWLRIGGYLVSPETAENLLIYDKFLQYESYDRF
jgi:LmbE family N-acetylglucosaminyl deacetylase